MFNLGKLDEARRLVCDFHYSRRMPSNIQVCATWHAPGGLFGDCGDAMAACIFSIPPTRWSEPVLELSRLVRDEGMGGGLTPLISWAAKRAKASGAHLLVSFADWTQQHHGGIYQAASWNYDGVRAPRMDGVKIDGVFYSGRTCNHMFGTQSPKKMSDILPTRTVEPSIDAGKHLYWRALTREGKRRAAALGLESNPYPKPDRDVEHARGAC